MMNKRQPFNFNDVGNNQRMMTRKSLEEKRDT